MLIEANALTTTLRHYPLNTFPPNFYLSMSRCH